MTNPNLAATPQPPPHQGKQEAYRLVIEDIFASEEDFLNTNAWGERLELLLKKHGGIDG